MAPVSQVDRVLGSMGQMRPPVLHLRDLRVGIVRVRPVVVRPLLLACPVEAGQLGARRRRDAGGLGQSGQPRVVPLARVPAHDASHRRVGFQRRRIDPDRVPLDEVGVGQTLQHPREHGLVRLEVDQAPGARQRRVVGRGLVQREVQKLADAQRVGGAPRDRPFRVQAFEVAEQQQPEIAARRQTRPADSVGVERRALRFDEGIEVRLVERAIQALVKRVPCALRQICGGHPHRRLARPAPSFAHRHARSVVRAVNRVDPYDEGLSPRAASSPW